MVTETPYRNADRSGDGQSDRFRLCTASPPRTICPGCGKEIDPDWCWCGDRVDQHTMGSGHSPVPMGCVCGYDADEDYRTDPCNQPENIR